MKVKTRFNNETSKRIGYWICYLLLLIYPMRHIHWGLDLGDTGYSYANFQYMGLEHMDSMWLYATYLANVVGNFLTKLPFAGSLMGMNFYTGLFVSGLSAAAFWFCTEKLQIPAWIALVGELAAISLCWCPTSLLYNYLGYVLFLTSVVLLYQGLVHKRMCCLFIAGICLGANVLVRFSNLPQAAMIVGVWAYAVIEAIEAQFRGIDEAAEGLGKRLGRIGRHAWKDIRRHTLWCLGGYLTALAVLFGYIQIRYGMVNYMEGILRLFSMTDNATDYKASSMIMGLVGTYVENLYWVVRIAVFIIAGVIYDVFVEVVLQIAGACRGKKSVKNSRWRNGFAGLLQGSRFFVGGVLALIMFVWLYQSGFCSTEYYSYGAILWPGVTFLMLTMGIAAIRILHPNCRKEEKLISGLIILVILLTSIGSNNKVYPSLNNLFIAAPYALWECWRFFTGVRKWDLKRLAVSAFPVKSVLAAFLGLFLIQTMLFGASFVFQEGTGAQQITATIDNNEILRGIRMHPERAQWMEEISAYAAENDLEGREVILYGEIPSLSYYLQMPSAFNPWSDLRSYSLEAMREDMQETIAEMEADTAKRPVVIVEKLYDRYHEEGTAALEADLEALPFKEQQEKLQAAYDKWLLIEEFMEKYGYHRTFSNEKFTIYE